MQVLAALLIALFALIAVASAFRGGHGRPLYGIIGDVQSVESSIPLRGFANHGGRAAARSYDQW
ncbi:Neuropeptide-Like Protein [Caenorhabditis elegans]